MALRIPTRTSDNITVISYIDTAIHFEHEDSDRLIKEYIQADAPDWSTLPMLDDDEPTKFVLRPLSEREMAIAEEMARQYNYTDDQSVDIDHNSAEANYQLIRFALVDVINAPDFTPQRERLYSANVLTIDSVSCIDAITAQFLALTVRRWSQLQKKRHQPLPTRKARAMEPSR